MTAQPEHIQEQTLRPTQCLAISPALLTFFRCHSYTQRQKFTDLMKSDNRDAGKKKLAKGSVPVSSSSPVSVLHQRYEGPIRFRSQSGNAFSPKTQNWGSFQRPEPDGSLPSVLLSSFISSLVAAHVSSRALVLGSFKASGYTQSLNRKAEKPGLVTL